MYLERTEETNLGELGSGAVFYHANAYYVVLSDNRDEQCSRVRKVAIVTPHERVAFPTRAEEDTFSWEMPVLHCLYQHHEPTKQKLARLKFTLENLKRELRAGGMTEEQLEEILK